MGDTPNNPNSKRPEPGSGLTRIPRASGMGALPSRVPTRLGGATVHPQGHVAPNNAKHDSKQRLLSKLSKVRPMSASAQRVIALTSDPQGDVATIADAISGDPSLATETLRIANSAAYRRAYPIDDLRRAVVTLGLEQARSMATAMALLGTVSSEHPLFDELHSTSVLAATLAGLLTTELFEVEKSTAFVAGLLSEMGAMACLMVDDDYAAVFRSGNGDALERQRAELEAYGMTTWEVGAQLLAKNRVPEAIVEAVSQPVDLRECAGATKLARITVFSRSAAPLILAAERDGTLTEARARLEELATLAGLDIGAETLLALCDWATSSASFMLGGSAI
jgi:HD-like signal output (HDOD) protein